MFDSRNGVGCDKLYLSPDVGISVFVLHNNHNEIQINCNERR